MATARPRLSWKLWTCLPTPVTPAAQTHTRTRTRIGGGVVFGAGCMLTTENRISLVAICMALHASSQSKGADGRRPED